MATTNLGDFSKAIEKMLEDYQQDVTESLEAGLDAAQDYLIEQIRNASPRDTGDYASHWKPGTSGKGYRRVINDKKVLWKGRQNVLAGILEYSTKHAKPHIEKTRRKARPRIMKILKESIQNTTK